MEIVEELAVEVVAAFEGGVEVVEKDDVEGAGFGVGGEVAVGVGRERGGRGEVLRDWGWKVLVEGGDALFVAVFEDVESRAVQAVDGFALIGDDDVDDGEMGGEVKNGFVGVGGWVGVLRTDGGR